VTSGRCVRTCRFWSALRRTAARGRDAAEQPGLGVLSCHASCWRSQFHAKPGADLLGRDRLLKPRNLTKGRRQRLEIMIAGREQDRDPSGLEELGDRRDAPAAQVQARPHAPARTERRPGPVPLGLHCPEHPEPRQARVPTRPAAEAGPSDNPILPPRRLLYELGRAIRQRSSSRSLPQPLRVSGGGAAPSQGSPQRVGVRHCFSGRASRYRSTNALSSSSVHPATPCSLA
jgi:hypothetical protein